MTKQIVFASHDPGGFNLLLPIIEYYLSTDWKVHLLLSGEAKRRSDIMLPKQNGLINYEIESFPCSGFPGEYDVKNDVIDNFLNTIKPKFILTSTSINSNIERYCISYAKSKKIPHASIIDSWVGDDCRFVSKEISVYPDHILVVDEKMKDVFRSIEQFGSEIAIVGNPHLDRLKRQAKENTYSTIEDRNRIVFFSENILHYFPDREISEFTIIERILTEYDSKVHINLSVRPHPLEDKQGWIKFADKHNGSNPNISLSVDTYLSTQDSISNSKLTFGISSMALIESSIFGKPTFSYQVDLPQHENMLYIPFEDYNIQCLRTMKEVLETLSSNPMSDTNSEVVSSCFALENIVQLIHQWSN